MTPVNVADYQRNPLGILRRAVTGHETIRVNTEDGDAVLLSGDEYRGLQETLYLMSIPGMKEKLTKGMKASAEECDDFEW